MITPHFHSSQHNPEANAFVGAFISNLIWGKPDRFGPHCCVAVAEGGNLIGGVVFHNCDEDAGIVELSGASVSRRWATAAVLNMVYDVAFNLLCCQMIMQRVKADNVVHLAQLRRLGLTETVIPRGAGRDMDLHLFTMTDDQWAAHPLKRRALDRRARASYIPD
jgi:hypothetical protein